MGRTSTPPGTGTDRRDLLVLTPVAILERHAWSVAFGIAAPRPLRRAALYLADPHDEEITAPHLDPLRLGGVVELIIRNAERVPS